jgi:hypothetical protein
MKSETDIMGFYEMLKSYDSMCSHIYEMYLCIMKPVVLEFRNTSFIIFVRYETQSGYDENADDGNMTPYWMRNHHPLLLTYYVGVEVGEKFDDLYKTADDNLADDLADNSPDGKSFSSYLADGKTSSHWAGGGSKRGSSEGQGGKSHDSLKKVSRKSSESLQKVSRKSPRRHPRTSPRLQLEKNGKGPIQLVETNGKGLWLRRFHRLAEFLRGEEFLDRKMKKLGSKLVVDPEFPMALVYVDTRLEAMHSGDSGTIGTNSGPLNENILNDNLVQLPPQAGISPCAWYKRDGMCLLEAAHYRWTDFLAEVNECLGFGDSTPTKSDVESDAAGKESSTDAAVTTLTETQTVNDAIEAETETHDDDDDDVAADDDDDDDVQHHQPITLTDFSYYLPTSSAVLHSFLVLLHRAILQGGIHYQTHQIISESVEEFRKDVIAKGFSVEIWEMWLSEGLNLFEFYHRKA